MICEGYKLNGYDATYRKTCFNVIEREGRVLEITDTESGHTFIVDLSESENRQKNRLRSWRKREERQEHHGTSVTFGNAYKGIDKDI